MPLPPELRCIQCGTFAPGSMLFCQSDLTEQTWSSHFLGAFSEYLLVLQEGTFSALCPSHHDLVGKIPHEGAHTVLGPAGHFPVAAQQLTDVQHLMHVMKLRCISCGAHVFGSMTVCDCELTREMWEKHYSGAYEQYVHVYGAARYSAVCPAHRHLIGAIPWSGAHTAAGREGQPPPSLLHLTTGVDDGTSAIRLRCIECGAFTPGSMAICDSGITRKKWHRYFSGVFEEYIHQDGGTTISALCLAHTGLVGKIPHDGAHTLRGQSVGGSTDMRSKASLKTSHLARMGMHLFRDREHGDVILRCGGQNIRAHRCVLAAVSPVFQAMFTTEMCEARTSSVTIDDAEPEDVEMALRFAYTGDLHDASHWGRVLRFAEKYDIDTLVTRCCAEMVVSLSVATAGEYLRALQPYESGQLADVFDYISTAVASNPQMARAAFRNI